jgi:hypothetical protein
LGKQDGRRKAGRPKLIWPNCLENDAKSTGVKRWRKRAGRQICIGCRSEGILAFLDSVEPFLAVHFTAQSGKYWDPSSSSCYSPQLS